MRILLVNPNTTEEMTADMGEQARRYARQGTEIDAVTPPFGPASVEGSYEEAISALAMVEIIRDRGADYDGVILACFGDPGLYAAREVSPAPVIGIGEASMLMACTVAHRFSIVTVLPRVKPILENVVKVHGMESRCTSIRTTPLSVLECEHDPELAEREIIKAARLAIDEDGAEAICLGCGGMGQFDQVAREALGVPVLDGIACAVKLMESMLDYGLVTSRVAAFKEPEPKEFVNYPVSRAALSA
jgi:allantoin racemase